MQPMKPPALVATWYAKGLRNPEALTAASRTFPRGTVLRVHHNRAWVDVVVNDYGPEAWTNRDLDLSRGAFRKLAALGVGVLKVRIEVLSAREENRTQRVQPSTEAVWARELQAGGRDWLSRSLVLDPWWPTVPHRVQEAWREAQAHAACSACAFEAAWLRRGGSR